MSKPMISPALVKEFLDYDPETGVFHWKNRAEKWFPSKRIYNSWNSRDAGKVAGTVVRGGYLIIKIWKSRYRAHRLAWAHVYGEWPEGEIDHINGVSNDNRIANLRVVSHSVNMQNQKRARRNNKTSGLLGVSLNVETGKFRARITVDNKERALGYFATPEEAHAAYISAKSDLHEGYAP